jgi:hypothetical protein
MAINSTNINKMNNHLSFKLNSLTQKRPLHTMLEIQVLAWDRHTNVVGLNQIMVSSTLPS